MIIMSILISCCGINCAQCDALKATLANDDELRKKVAAEWSVMYQSPSITAESINCTGCRAEGVKFAHCLTTCDIRRCVHSKGFQTCADCEEIDSCEIVGPLFQVVPDARNNLRLLE